MNVMEIEVNGPSLQDENLDPLNNKVEQQSTTALKVESKKNKRNQRELVKNLSPETEQVVDPGNINSSVSNRGPNNKTKSLPSNKKKKEKNLQINCSTGIQEISLKKTDGVTFR